MQEPKQTDVLAGLPDEVRELLSRPQQMQTAQLDALGTTIAQMRDEAVTYRKQSGIEDEWLLCEEYYAGIDDKNRGEFAGARGSLVKPMSLDGPLIRADQGADPTKATAFVMVTARYVNAGTAKVCELALPNDGKPFTLKSTPVPEMAGALGDATPAEQITGQAMPGLDGQPVSVDTLAKHAIEKAEKAAEKAATRIHDWMVEYKHNTELRKVIFDGARLGVGVLCGPIPESKRTIVVRKGPPADPMAQGAAPAPVAPTGSGGVTVEIVDTVKPVARWIDPWCFYPAPGCGEDIHKGDHAFEVTPMLEGQIAKLAEMTDLYYLPEQIAKVIEQGPNKSKIDRNAAKERVDDKTYDVWHMRGAISRDDFEAVNKVQAEAVPKSMDKVDVVITLINDVVVRAVQSPMDSGRLPYHVFCWSRRRGHWAGVGVGEQVRTPNKIVNGATRAMLNNAASSSGAHVVMDPNMVEPADGNPRLGVGDKLWWVKNGIGVEDVRKVFASFQWPNMTPQLMNIVEYGFKLAEEHSSIPLITQGQSGKTTPDTFSGQQLQDNNANQLLRNVGFALNDTVTTPLVDQFYEWLLLDENVPDDEKGDYQVDTSGALAIIEKSLHDQTILAIGGMVQNPAFGIDPAKWFESYVRSKRLSPAEFQYTKTEKEKLAQQPPPEDPAITAAKIRAESAEKIAGSRDQLAGQKNQNDLDRDNAYQQSLNERDRDNATLRIEELKLKVRLAELEHATQERISVQEAKVALARDTMKLTVQKEIAGSDGVGPQVATPATEPPGQAPDGTAFQR